MQLKYYFRKELMLYKKIIISAAIIAVFGFGFSLDKFADGPVKKDMNSKMKAQKDIDAGLFNKNTNDNTGPGPNSIASVINESFEGTIYPPPGWTKLNPDNGTGWNQQILGTIPIPGWTSGSITVPPGGGNKVAFCTWTTGGTSSNNQYLVTPQITNVQPNDSLKFYLRYWPDSFRDSFEVLISTDTPVASNLYPHLDNHGRLVDCHVCYPSFRQITPCSEATISLVICFLCRSQIQV